MRARLGREDGNVLVIAVTMMALMLGLGSAALSTVDTQTDVVLKERRHESSFNLAEGVLNAQTFVLARLGTGGLTTQFPSAVQPVLDVDALPGRRPGPAQLRRRHPGRLRGRDLDDDRARQPERDLLQ